MSTRKCCVSRCYNTRSDIILHKFPNPETNLERFMIWTEFIGGDIVFWNKNVVFQQYKICNSHFESKYQSGSGRLTKNAIPTLFPLLSEKALPKKHDSTKQVESTATETPRIYFSSTKDTFSDEMQSKLIEMSQGCTTSENDTLLEEEQIKLTHTIQRGVIPRTYSKQGLQPQESLVPELFSWQAQSEPEHIPQDEPELVDDEDDGPDNLSMCCDDDTASLNAKLISSKRHEGFHCDSCSGDILGYRYTCVQCSGLDLCVTCESSGAHAHHYVLRVPGPRPYREIQTVLASMRRHLMRELDPISAAHMDSDDRISVKSDIKSENEEDVEVEQVDNLHEDTLRTEIIEDSKALSSGSDGLENTISKDVSQNEAPVKRREGYLIIKHDGNQNAFVRMSDKRESKPPNTAKRKIILSLSDFLKLTASNYKVNYARPMSVSNEKIRVLPTTKTIRLSRGTRTSLLEPNRRLFKQPRKADIFNPVAELTKLTSGDLLEQGQTAKKVCVKPRKGSKETSKGTAASSLVKSSAMNPVEKLSKRAKTDCVQVSTLKKQQVTMNNRDGNRWYNM